MLVQRKTKKSPPSQNLSSYQGAVKKHLIERFGEDRADPESLDHVPDGRYMVTVNTELCSAYIRNGRIVGIGRVEQKPLPTLQKAPPKRRR